MGWLYPANFWRFLKKVRFLLPFFFAIIPQEIKILRKSLILNYLSIFPALQIGLEIGAFSSLELSHERVSK